ncbi:MAG: DUF308 domain-containing protein [Candidatus Gastranaerophilales bacterium]|nr:DUF308 domain-containing protein [Candidatus Gastranaerophilales bacterium]
MYKSNYSKCLSFFVSEGIIFTILGILMLFMPMVTSYAAGLIISILLFIGGLYKFVNSIINRNFLSKPVLSIIIGLLMISAGVILTIHPMINMFLLTIILATYFILEGINSLNFGVQNRDLLNYWWLSVVVSLIQFMLAAIILASLPFSALVTVGLLLSVDFIFSGLTLLGLSSTCKYVVPRE